MMIPPIQTQTIFNTPILKTLLKGLSIAILKLMGWKIKGKEPKAAKYVMIAAPHTSNWDFIFTLLFAFAFNLQPNIMGKKELLDWPGGKIFTWLGLIPIDRSKSNNIVSWAVDMFSRYDNLCMIVPPSGTRSRVRKWKTGFYRIADGAGVPISLTYLDWGRKTGGIGELFTTTGDIDADMIHIRAFYADMTGKYPEQTLEHAAEKALLLP